MYLEFLALIHESKFHESKFHDQILIKVYRLAPVKVCPCQSYQSLGTHAISIYNITYAITYYLYITLHITRQHKILHWDL